MYIYSHFIQLVFKPHNRRCLACHTLQRDTTMPICVCLCASLVTSALGSCVLLRCKKWRCDKHSSGDVACKHQSFGRCAVSKLAVYSPWPSHTPLSGLRLIVCRLPYEEQLIHTESNCKRTEWRVEKVEGTEWWKRKEWRFVKKDREAEVNEWEVCA